MKNTKRFFKMTPELHQKIVNMLKQGLYGYDIALEVGCSQATVGKVRKELMAQGLNYWHPDRYYGDRY